MDHPPLARQEAYRKRGIACLSWQVTSCDISERSVRTVVRTEAEETLETRVNFWPRLAIARRQ